MDERIWWWVRGVGFTCGIATDTAGRIVETAPYLWRFRGQSLDNLRFWSRTIELRRLGNGA